MKPKTLLRLAAACLIFFAIGHSFGHFARHNPSDPKEREMLDLMAKTKFDMFGQMRSFDENYDGMSLNLILTLLMMSFLLWIISSFADKYPRLSFKLLFPIIFCTAGFAFTSWLYFFPVPAFSCLPLQFSWRSRRVL